MTLIELLEFARAMQGSSLGSDERTIIAIACRDEKGITDPIPDRILRALEEIERTTWDTRLARDISEARIWARDINERVAA